MTPRFVMTSSDLSRGERIRIHRAGAWDVLTPPIDGELLLVRIQTLLDAKVRADEVLAGGLVDREAGCYNLAGIRRRVRECASDAGRHEHPFACVTIGPVVLSRGGPAGEDAPNGTELREVVDAAASALRASDALGWIEPGLLVVVAPSTDPAGATRMAERLLASLERKVQESIGDVRARSNTLRAGVFSTRDEGLRRLAPDEILDRAQAALSRAHGSTPEDGRIGTYPA